MTAVPTGIGSAGQGPDQQGIKAKLRKVFDELVQVRIITVVGNVAVTFSDAGQATVDTGQKSLSNAIVTTFDLIDGDVTNVIAPALKDDEAMRSFHASQVEMSMAVLPANLAALVDFAKALLHDLQA